MRLQEIAVRLGATLVDHGSPDRAVDAVAAPRSATGDDLVFAESEQAMSEALISDAGAILATPALAHRVTDRPVMVANHPKLAFAQAAQLLQRAVPFTGLHPTAVVDATAHIGAHVSIGPGAVVGSGAKIGDESVIEAGVVVGAGVSIGARCRIYPRVVLYPGTEVGNRVVVHAGAVLGADGFGYVRDSATGAYTQFPQQGRLVIEDDVEIGANTTIDRGALAATRIERGAKLDNLVHVGHNVQIGSDVVIAAQTGISGSSVVGDGAVIGGQAGMGDHAELGPGVILGGQAGILPGKRLLGPGVVMWGTPAKPVREYLRELASLARLGGRGRESR